MRLIVVAAMAIAAALTGLACSPPTAPSATVSGGDQDRGRQAIEQYGCAACHAVPGIRQAERATVGPPLSNYGERRYIAGVLVNSEENLVRWITDPKAVNPRTAMPDLGVSELEARDIVAYLYSSR